MSLSLLPKLMFPALTAVSPETDEIKQGKKKQN